jgi:SAM-dependent methyltransferase
MRLIDEHPPRGGVLDLGCGTGDLAIALAERGLSVLGVDFADDAIDTALERLRTLPQDGASLLEFRVGDALRPSQWAGRIGSAVDSGFYHLFDGGTRRTFLLDLAEALPPRGRFYLFGFAISLPGPDVPHEVTRVELASHFSTAAGWEILALRAASFQTSGFGEVPALALCAERTQS